MADPIQLPDNKYRSGGMIYPADLMSPSGEYGGNYVLFNINVNQQSYLVKGEGGKDKFLSVADTPPAKRDSMSGTGVNQVTEAAVLTGMAVVGTNALDPAGKISNAAGYSLKPGREAVANTLGGLALAGGTAFALGGTRNDYQQQLQSIALYIPNDLSIKYGVVWDETSLAGTAAMMAGAENLGAAALKVGAGYGIGKLATKAMGGRGAKILPALGAAGGALMSANNLSAGADIAAAQALKAPGAGEYLSKSTGMASNPKKEQLFKEVRFRDFSYNYQFFPRSSAEARSVIAIIKEFKKHMHPEFRDNAQFLYIYPSEFQITYYTGGAVSPYLPKHTSCVLTDMSVQYSPQGVYTSFEDGMPTQINLSLSFRELALLTKQDIDAGY